MDNSVASAPLAEDFDSRSDDALRDIIDQARSVLKARENERKKQAVSEIRRIAKQNGLDVAVGKPARKRGRSPKASNKG